MVRGEDTLTYVQEFNEPVSWDLTVPVLQHSFFRNSQLPGLQLETGYFSDSIQELEDAQLEVSISQKREISERFVFPLHSILENEVIPISIPLAQYSGQEIRIISKIKTEQDVSGRFRWIAPVVRYAPAADNTPHTRSSRDISL